jgi:protein ImuB
VWFPSLALDRWRRLRARERAAASPDEAAPEEASGPAPLALVADGPHGPVLHALDAEAAGLGLRPGARLADARAAVPSLRAEPADPEGDAAALGAMAAWTRRWAPWTAPDGAHDGPGEGGLVLDLTGSAHLLGGDAAALADMEARLAALGYAARAAVAPTRGAAWALARHGAARSEARVVTDGAGLERALAPLPVRALRLAADDARALEGLGLATVGALAALPRAALARRFPRARRATARKAGAPAGPVLRLDQAMGRAPEPVDPSTAPPRFAARARLAEPVLDAVPLLPGLAADLALALERECRGARRLRLTVFRTDGTWRGAEVSTAAATRDAGHMVRLLGTALGRVDPGFGFDAALLEAPRTEAQDARQARLDGAADPDRDLAALIDRLATRFGRDAVAWAVPRGSHLPERAEARLPALSGPPPGRDGPDMAAGPERPLRLFDPPEELRVIYALPEGPPLRLSLGGPVSGAGGGGRGGAGFRVLRHSGPERIAPEWWRAAPGTRLRDYWQAELEDGRRLWLYREGLPDDGRGGAPRWFLHGLFA